VNLLVGTYCSVHTSLRRPYSRRVGLNLFVYQQVSKCVWDADGLVYWVESRRLPLRASAARRAAWRGRQRVCWSVWQVSECVWEADELVYWVESRRLQLRASAARRAAWRGRQRVCWSAAGERVCVGS